MGKHRSQTRQWRGVGSGIRWGLVAVVVIAAIVIAWIIVSNRSKEEGRNAASECVEGNARVTIAANSELVQPLSEIAKSFNATRPVARDHCISVSVTQAGEQTVFDGVTRSQGWDEAQGPMPTGWIPSSSVWSSQLIAAQPTKVNGTPRSLVRSPVLLAVAGPVQPKIADTGWGTIPALHNTDGSLVLTGLTGWGSLRLAMPTGSDSDATFLAAQAMAAKGEDKLSDKAATSRDFASTLRTMIERAPKDNTGTTADALKALSADPSADNPIHAVVATEQQLYAASQQSTDGKDPAIKTVIPAGAAPVADFPVVRLSGKGVDQAQTEGLDRFITYVSDKQRLATLTRAGFRPPAGAPAGPLPQPGPISDFAPLGQTLRTPDEAAQNAITAVLRR